MTVIINIDSLNNQTYEVKNASLNSLGDNNSNLEDEFGLENIQSKIVSLILVNDFKEIINKKEDNSLVVGSSVKVKIDKLLISQGQVVLYGSLLWSVLSFLINYLF